TSYAEFSVANPGIQEHVGEVDEQIDRYIDEGEEQDHALDRREVARQNRIDGEPTQTGNGVHRFGDYYPADQDRDADAEHGGARHRGVGERVAHQHANFGQALGAGRADVVLAERLEHRSARDAGDERDVDDRQ